MDNDLKKNLKSGYIWLRLLYMLLFAIVLQVSIAVFWLVTLLQFIFSLITGKPNQKLAPFADSLSEFIAQILRFECFVSEEKPFPFADFPEATMVEETAVDVEVSAESEPDSAEILEDQSDDKK